MRHPQTLIDAVVRCYGTMRASEVAIQYAMTRNAVCGIWERAKRDGRISAAALERAEIDAAAFMERPFIKFNVYEETYAAFDRMAKAARFDSVPQWVRHVATQAALAEIEKVRAERRANAAAGVKTDLEKVKELLGRKYTGHAIAALTRMPYARVQRLIGEARQCA